MHKDHDSPIYQRSHTLYGHIGCLSVRVRLRVPLRRECSRSLLIGLILSSTRLASKLSGTVWSQVNMDAGSNPASSTEFESLKCFVGRVRCGLTAGRACPTRQIKKAPCWVPFFIWWSWRDLNPRPQ